VNFILVEKVFFPRNQLQNMAKAFYFILSFIFLENTLFHREK